MNYVPYIYKRNVSISKLEYCVTQFQSDIIAYRQSECLKEDICEMKESDAENRDLLSARGEQ